MVVLMAAVDVGMSVATAVPGRGHGSSSWPRPSGVMAMVLAVAVFIPRHSNAYLVVERRKRNNQQRRGGGLRKRFRNVNTASLLFWCFLLYPNLT